LDADIQILAIYKSVDFLGLVASSSHLGSILPFFTMFS
jgi:hypothetical protein